mgnify:CR=1 FL=1
MIRTSSKEWKLLAIILKNSPRKKRIATRRKTRNQTVWWCEWMRGSRRAWLMKRKEGNTQSAVLNPFQFVSESPKNKRKKELSLESKREESFPIQPFKGGTMWLKSPKILIFRREERKTRGRETLIVHQNHPEHRQTWKTNKNKKNKHTEKLPYLGTHRGSSIWALHCWVSSGIVLHWWPALHRLEEAMDRSLDNKTKKKRKI